MANTTPKAVEASYRNWCLKMIASFLTNLDKMEGHFPAGSRNFENLRFELRDLDEKIRKYNAADEQMRLELDKETEAAPHLNLPRGKEVW